MVQEQASSSAVAQVNVCTASSDSTGRHAAIQIVGHQHSVVLGGATVIANGTCQCDVAAIAAQGERVAAPVEISNLHRTCDVDRCPAGGDVPGQVIGATARARKTAIGRDGDACSRAEVGGHDKVTTRVNRKSTANIDITGQHHIACGSKCQVIGG